MTRRFLVSGGVQGVGFRWFVVRRARSLGLTGFVRNLSDGRVEVIAEGSGPSLVALEGELQQGPTAARVEAVHREDSPHGGYVSFEVH